jgi:hypothetical protein
MSDGKREMETSTINKYIDNKNYANDLYSELHEKRREEGNSSSDNEETVSQFHEIQKEIKEIEKTKPRYCSKEDISTLEVREYSFTDDKHLSLKRNFISDVEEDDLKELMCKLDNQIYEEEYHNDGDGELISLKKCMKSLVRIVHRFGYTREHHIPVTETHQSRDANSIW